MKNAEKWLDGEISMAKLLSLEGVPYMQGASLLAYVEGSGHSDNKESMQAAIASLDLSPENLLKEANALETRAANLREIAAR